MKKFVIAAAAATSLGLIASPAAAQSASGTVNVTGSVAAKCTASTPIGGNIVLNELAQSDGTVDSAFSNASNLFLDFTVRCTSPNPGLSLNATALANGTTGAGNGYADTVHYTSTLAAQKAGGGVASINYTTADVLPAASTGAIGDRLANVGDNIRVTVSNGTTTNTGDLLTAGSYSGTITLTVSPS